MTRTLSILALICTMAACGGCKRPKPKEDGGRGSDHISDTRRAPDVVDRLIDEAKTRQRDKAKQEIAAANDKLEKAKQTIDADPNLKPAQKDAAKKAIDASKDANGMSPAAQKIIDAEANTEKALDAAGAAAKQQPPDKQEQAAKDGAAKAENDGEQARQDANKQGEHSVAKDLLNTLGPVAAGAVCLYFTGSPEVCAGVAKIVGQILKGLLGDPKDAGESSAWVDTAMNIFSSSCDAECVDGALRAIGLDTKKVGEFVDQTVKQADVVTGDVKNKLEQAKQIANQVQDALRCFDQIKTKPNPASELLNRCKTFFHADKDRAVKAAACLDNKDLAHLTGTDLVDTAHCLVHAAGDTK